MKILKVDFGPLHVRVRTHTHIMCIHTCIPTHPPTFKHTVQKCIHTKNIITVTEAGCLQTCIIFSGKRADVVTRNHSSQILERLLWNVRGGVVTMNNLKYMLYGSRFMFLGGLLLQKVWRAGVWVLSPGFLTHPALGVGHEG